MGKNSSPEFMLPLLLMTALCLEANVRITILSSSERLSWNDARLFCQKNHVDMVTWDIVGSDWLAKQFGDESNNFWIGLHRDPVQNNVWKWINVTTGEGLSGDDVAQEVNWSTIDLVGGNCGSFSPMTKELHKSKCVREYRFFCYDDNLVVVNENKTWEDALSHCREMSTPSKQYDLLSLTRSVNSYVSKRIYRAATDEVWSGLRFLGGEWWWSDGTELNHGEKLPACPTMWKHCGTVPKYDAINWITRDCSERKNFICYYKNAV
ncbi:lymphocyte antigen 75-like [Leuresthes tenuis]|uniref:lymphocyte antigen 75-like n=1 Tax=Leuresthes tenuis TaxID=355514 RepID=UPI003B50DA33